MVWFVENCWWIVLIVFAIVIGLAIALYVITKKEKKIKNDFKEKILFLEKVGDDSETQPNNDIVAEKEDIVVENADSQEVSEVKEVKKTTRKTSTAKSGTKRTTTGTKSGTKKTGAKKSTSKSSTAKKTGTKKKTTETAVDAESK